MHNRNVSLRALKTCFKKKKTDNNYFRVILFMSASLYFQPLIIKNTTSSPEDFIFMRID